MPFTPITPTAIGVVTADGSTINLNMLLDAGNYYPMSLPYRGGEVLEPVRQYLDLTGDGTGTTDAAVDYSSSQGIFRIAPATGVVYRIHRLVITIRDGTAVNFTSTSFGALSVLTNGVDIRHETGDGTSVVKEMMGGVHIKDNVTFQTLGAEINMQKWGTDAAMQAVFDFTAQNGEPMRLDGTPDEELIIRLDDDLSALSGLHFVAIGYVE